MLRSLIAGGMLMLAVFLFPLTARAGDTVRVDLKIVDDGQPVAAATVVIYLSCDKVEGVTDAQGTVSLESDCGGRVYWVEINSRRVGEVFRTNEPTRTIDLAHVTYIDWPEGD